MLGTDLETPVHSAPWWVGLGVLLLGLYAAREWRAARRTDAHWRQSTALPAVLSIVGLALVWAGLTMASNDGALPTRPARQPTSAAAKGTAAPELVPSVSRPPREPHRVAQLARHQPRPRVPASGVHHRGAAMDRPLLTDNEILHNARVTSMRKPGLIPCRDPLYRNPPDPPRRNAGSSTQRSPCAPLTTTIRTARTPR